MNKKAKKLHKAWHKWKLNPDSGWKIEKINTEDEKAIYKAEGFTAELAISDVWPDEVIVELYFKDDYSDTTFDSLELALGYVDDIEYGVDYQ